LNPYVHESCKKLYNFQVSYRTIMRNLRFLVSRLEFSTIAIDNSLTSKLIFLLLDFVLGVFSRKFFIEVTL